MERDSSAMPNSICEGKEVAEGEEDGLFDANG